MSDDLSTATIDAVRGITKRICPLDCPRGQHAEKEMCVANAPPEHDAKPRRSATPSANRTTAPVARAAAPPPDRPLPSIPLSIGIGGGHGGLSIGIGP